MQLVYVAPYTLVVVARLLLWWWSALYMWWGSIKQSDPKRFFIRPFILIIYTIHNGFIHIELVSVPRSHILYNNGGCL